MSLNDSRRPALYRFSITAMVLTVIALVLGGVAWDILGPGAKPAAKTPPARGVYAGTSGQAAIDAARADASKAETAGVAYGGTTSGKAIYGHLCRSCHGLGIAGAPRLGDTSAWKPRIAQGMPTLIAHALNGYTGPHGNRMPAKGGNPRLSRAQVASTVRWMVRQSR